MRNYKILCILLSVMLLTNCNSMDDLAGSIDDLKDTGSVMLSRATDGQDFSANCPKIEIVEDLGTLNEFTTNTKPTEQTLISKVELSVIDNSCIHNQKSVTANVKLAFKSTLGPKAKMADSDKPFITYPFFVAITQPNGKIMAKEVFAASMSYTASETEHTYYETLRPIIPISKKSKAGKYKILIGFQLDEAQLEYNRVLNEQKQSKTPKVETINE